MPKHSEIITFAKNPKEKELAEKVKSRLRNTDEWASLTPEQRSKLEATEISEALTNQRSTALPFYKISSVAFDILDSIKEFKLLVGPELPRGFQWYDVRNGEFPESPDLKKILPLEDHDNEYLCELVLDAINAQPGGQSELLEYIIPILPGCKSRPENQIRIDIVDKVTKLANNEPVIHLAHCVDPKPGSVGFYTSFIPGNKVSGLTYQDFFPWLMGSAEMDAMAMHIGRTCVGPQGAILAGADNPLDHSFRYAAFLIGQPLIGKSYYKDFLINGLHALNMRTAVIQPLGKPFNHGSWVTADLAYYDDTTTSTLNQFYHSDLFKSVCSNSVIKVEQKGENAYDVKGLASILVLANEIDPRDITKADTGNSQRIWHIATKAYDPDIIPYAVFTRLADKYNLSQIELAHHLFRICTDYFLSFDTMAGINKCREISDELYYTSNNKPLSKLALSSIWLWIQLTGASIEETQAALLKANNSTNTIVLMVSAFCALRMCPNTGPIGQVVNILHQDWLDNNKPVNHPWNGFDAYANGSASLLADRIPKAADLLKRTGLDNSSDKVFKALFENVSDKNGVATPWALSSVHGAFKDAAFIQSKACTLLPNLVKPILDFLISEIDFSQYYIPTAFIQNTAKKEWIL